MIEDNGMYERIDRKLVQDALIGQSEFNISFDITPSGSGDSGEIMRLGTSFVMSVDRNGEVLVRAEADTGEMLNLRSTGAGMDDAAPKAISLVMLNGELTLEIDGETVGQIDMPSPITANGWSGHDFYLGNPWGKNNFASTLSDLTIVNNAEGELSSADSGISLDAGQLQIIDDFEELLASGEADSAVNEPTAPVSSGPSPQTAENAIHVSSAKELYAALAAAEGGETILLASGNYGTLFLAGKTVTTFPEDVTIASADVDNPASFSGLDIRGGSHMIFSDLVFDYTFSSDDPIYTRPFSVSGSEDIQILRSVFDGDLAKGVSAASDGHGWGIGFAVRGSTNVTLDQSEIFGFHRAATFSQSRDLTVTGNDIHDIRMDGLNFVEIRGALIDNNKIYNFDRAWGTADHSDMIQFWTNGSKTPTEDIVISNNHLDIGNGGYTQSIFMRNDQVDRGLAGPEMFYQNITIENNTIVNGHLHGITIGETNGLVIANNSVLHSDGGYPDGLDRPIEIPRINVSSVSKNVEITGNVTSDLIGWKGQSGWTVNKNAFVQDQDSAAKGYYDDVFVSSSLKMGEDRLHKFLVRDGGMVDDLGAGSKASYGNNVGLDARFQVVMLDGESGTRYFDGRQSTFDGKALPDGAKFDWTFGDGTTVEGSVIARNYLAGTDESATLKVTLPGGLSASTNYEFAVEGLQMLHFEAGGDFYANGNEVIDTGRFLTDEGLDLGAHGTSVSVDAHHVAELVGAEEFNISFGLETDGHSSRGEVFRYGTSLIVNVDSDGELLVRAVTDEGRVSMRTNGIDLSDMRQHDIDLTLSDGVFEISMDGDVISRSNMSGTLKESYGHGLYFGNPWGHQNVDGVMTDFEMTQNASSFDFDLDDLGAAVMDIVPFM